LHAVLSDDVVAWSDGGAARHAARRPVLGVDRVARFVAGIARQGQSTGAMDVHTTRVNGEPGVAILTDGELTLVMAFEFGPHGIRAIRSVVNPEKLDHLRDAVARWG
jgi:RNA polymerase sigma-70 factor (ECF subfamily)